MENFPALLVKGGGTLLIHKGSSTGNTGNTMQYKVNYNFADKCKTYDMIYIKEHFCNGK